MTQFLAAIGIYVSAVFLNKSLTGQWRPFSVLFFLALGHHIGLELL